MAAMFWSESMPEAYLKTWLIGMSQKHPKSWLRICMVECPRNIPKQGSLECPRNIPNHGSLECPRNIPKHGSLECPRNIPNHGSGSACRWLNVPETSQIMAPDLHGWMSQKHPKSWLRICMVECPRNIPNHGSGSAWLNVPAIPKVLANHKFTKEIVLSGLLNSIIHWPQKLVAMAYWYLWLRYHNVGHKIRLRDHSNMICGPSYIYTSPYSHHQVKSLLGQIAFLN